MHTNMEATGESWVMLMNGLYLVLYSYLCVLCVCARMKGMYHFVCFPISCSDYHSFVMESMGLEPGGKPV